MIDKQHTVTLNMTACACLLEQKKLLPSILLPYNAILKRCWCSNTHPVGMSILAAQTSG